VTKPKLDGANTPLAERTRRTDAILAEEQARLAANTAKIAGLRELRLARVAALNEAAAAVAKAKQAKRPGQRNGGE
jgi:hypothetical protein